MGQTEQKNDSKKMTSIARRINTGFWLKRLFSYIGIDILIVALIVATYIYWCVDLIPGGYENCRDLEYTYNDNSELELVVTDENYALYYYNVEHTANYIVPPLIVLVIFEGIDLFFALFRTGEIRRKLKPLNDLAIKAEQISSIPLDTTSLEHLEQAIASVSPDAAEEGIHTGDKELQSIEVALNNLLHRMKESERQQTRFVSDASHELRTPISVIQGYVNMLDRWGKEDESVLEESIEALKTESEHMKELIEQLLFLARGDSGRNTLKKIDFDLVDVVQEVWEESMMIDDKHKYVFKQARMEGQEGEAPIIMHGDVAMIKQSIRIFVQNAAKYSDSGDTITFSVKREDNRVSYSIQDEGIGMQESDVAHIFERFYRSDEARNGDTGGSGLGLSIAKWIVDAHGGNINVLSRPDFGTRFTVSF
ncbi:MAG: sensor histidine kinase [Wujia sp.]